MTSPPIRHGLGNSSTSRHVRRRTPARPPSAPFQKVLAPVPIGDTMPRPVITGTRRQEATPDAAMVDIEDNLTLIRTTDRHTTCVDAVPCSSSRFLLELWCAMRHT